MQRRKFFKRIVSASLLASPVLSALAKLDLASPVDNGCTEPVGWQGAPAVIYEGRTCPVFGQHITGWVVEMNPIMNEQPFRITLMPTPTR